MSTNDTTTNSTTTNAPADEKPPAQPQVLAFAVAHQVLTDALAFVVKGLPTRPSVPVLTGVLIEGDADGVAVKVFDYEQARTYDLVGAALTQPGKVLVSAKRLTEMVKKLRKGAVVALAGEGVKVRLNDGKTNYALPTMPVEDYPTLPDMPPVVGMVDSAQLLGAAVPVAGAAGRDEKLPMMTGVRLEAKGSTLSLLATDRYRLEHRDVTWEPAVGDFEALIPAVTLVEFVKPLAKLDSAITVYHGAEGACEGRMAFEAGPARAYTRLLDGGNYPPVRSLFPKSITAHADINAGELLDAIGRVELAAERTTPVLLDFTTSGVRLSAGDGEAEASEDVDADWFGPNDAERAKLVKAAIKRAEKDAITDKGRERAVAEAKRNTEAAFNGVCIGFNPTYLAAGVKAAGAKRVRFELVDAFKPAVIRPLDGDGEPDANVRHLIMPIRVNGRGGDAVADAKAASEQARQTAALDAARQALADGAVTAKPAAKPARKASAPAKPAPMAVAPVAPVAGAAVVLDRNTPHDFVRAVDNGKPVIWATKCLCGTTFHAKVHRDQDAGGAQPAAEPVAEQPAVDERPWRVVMTLAERVGGRLTTVATERRAKEALRGFRVSAMPVVVDEQGKRLYVGAKDEDMAKRMQQAAMGKQVPARIERGELPEASAKEVPVVAGEEVDVTDPRQVSESAFVKFGSGDYEGALALIEAGAEATPDFEFADEAGETYGWDKLREGVELQQMQAELAGEPEADEEPQAEADDEQGTDADDDAGAVVAGAVLNVDDVAQILAEALAGHPDEVVAAAISTARAKLGPVAKAAKAAAKAAKVAAKAGKAGKAAKAAQPVTVKAAPAKPATVKVQPVVSATTAVWASLGLTPPVSSGGERVVVLPRGTRVRAARKEVLARLDAAHAAGELPEKALVNADRDERPARLRIRFATQGVMTAAVAVVDRIVAEVLPEFLPAGVNA